MFNKKTYQKKTRYLISQTKIGIAGHTYTEETLKKQVKPIQLKITEETRYKISTSLKNRKHSKQAISKLTTAMLNKKLTFETSEKMIISHNKAVVSTNVDSSEVRNIPLLNLQRRGLILPVQQ